MMSSNKRIYSLDLLKFIAAVLIIFHHFQQSFDIRYSRFNFFGGDIYFGYLVELFFILSGFFVTLRANKRGPETFTAFMVKRVMRIYPMVWISVTVHAVTLTAYAFITGKELAPIGIWKYIKSMLLISNVGIMDSGENGFNNPTWYLGVLVICYALFWLAGSSELTKKTGFIPVYIFLVLFGLGICSYELRIPFINADTARGIIPFFSGCVLYYIYEKLNRRVAVFTSSIVIIASAAAYIISKEAFYDDLQYILLFAVYPSVTLLMLDSSVMGFLFDRKFFGELGKISFEMYIWHVPVFSLIKLLAAKDIVSMPASFADMLVVTGVITLISTAMFYFVEKPIDRLLKGIRVKKVPGSNLQQSRQAGV